MQTIWKWSLACTICTLVLALVIPSVATATTFTTVYVNETGVCTVKVADVPALSNWNDLEVDCDSGDLPGHFSTTTPSWTVNNTQIFQEGNRYYIKLNRASQISSGETIVITGPLNRGGRGLVTRTITGTFIDGAVRATYTFPDKAPALTTWGLGVLMLLLLGSAAWILWRRRRTPVTA